MDETLRHTHSNMPVCVASERLLHAPCATESLPGAWGTALNHRAPQPWLGEGLLNEKEMGLRIQTPFQDLFLGSKT